MNPTGANALRARLAPPSLRGRVVLTVLALLVVLLVVLFTVVDLALGARLRSDLRTRLTDRVALAQQLDSSLSARQLVDKLRGEGVTALLCTEGSGCVSAAPVPAPPGAPDGDAQPPDGSSTPATAADPTTAGSTPRAGPAGKPRPAGGAAVQQDGTTLYVRTVLADGQQLTLSVDDSAASSAVSRLVVLEVVGGALTLLVAGLVLGRLVGVALRPLDDMTALARRIARGQRGARLGTARPDTELGRTASAFDAMLDELEDAAAAARAAEGRMRSFLADASHELRTPLAGVQASAENLLRRQPGRAEAEQVLAGIVRESRRSARLVADLLTSTRLEEGSVALRPEPFDLAALAREEVERHRVLAPRLTWTTAGDPTVAVVADPMRIGQVVTNLLDNARNATPAGGAVGVVVRGGAAGGVATLDVVDTGAGIPVADRERVFDRLVRLDAARSRASGGAGLGLPIARAIARAHGGDLVATDPGESGAGGGGGAHLRLVLPLGVG